MGHEKTLTGLIPVLAGADMIYGPGMLESGITFDLAQLALDCEFARMIKHTVNGIPVNQETIALDVIQEIGHANNLFDLLKNTSVNAQIVTGKDEVNTRVRLWITLQKATPMLSSARTSSMKVSM